MLGSPTQKQKYICTRCNHSWTDWLLDVSVPCPACGSHDTLYKDSFFTRAFRSIKFPPMKWREIKGSVDSNEILNQITYLQTTIIHAYGKEFVFTVPLGDHTPIMDDEAKECVLMVGEDVYSPDVDILEQAF